MRKTSILASILIISFFAVGCNQKQTVKQPKVQNPVIKKELKKTKEGTAKNAAVRYLSFVSQGKNNEAAKILISNKHSFITAAKTQFTIEPKQSPFSYIKVNKIVEQKVKTLKPEGFFFQYTVTADIKYPGDSKLYEETAFFMTAVKEDGRWKTGGISTEF